MPRETPLFPSDYDGDIFLANIDGASFFLNLNIPKMPVIAMHTSVHQSAVYVDDIINDRSIYAQALRRYHDEFKQAFELAKKYLQLA